MKNQKLVSLPYPVLGIEGDFKQGNLEISAKIHSDDELLYVAVEDFKISNAYLKSLYSAKKIVLVCKIDCSSTLYNETLICREDSLKIPTKNLASQVEFEFFLIASEDISNYHHESFGDDFFVGGSKGTFSLTKGDIVGFAGSYSINLDKTFAEGLKSLFDWKEYSDGDRSFVNFATTAKKIEVYYPKIQDGHNLLNQISGSKAKTFLALFALPALNYAFGKMIEEEKSGDIESYCENNDWANFLKVNYENWDQENTYESAQDFLMILMAAKWHQNISPIVYAVDEVVDLRMNR